ncbi:MAG: methyltransferase domain-containing protein [Flammeovirgaceae bacterium]|nr:methyltransferase domain-containing protein [Flammeovirgaceae bacterium]
MIEVVYPENSFDFISFGAVLEHVYSPADSILRTLRWLKPNGIIHIEVPSSDWLINKIINFITNLY